MLLLAEGCGGANGHHDVSVLAVSSGSSQSAPAAGHLRPKGRALLKPDGRAWQWHGISAFRLVEFVAHDRGPEAARYLDWASTRGVTVVRVLAMAKHLFALDPAEGRAALPGLLEMAARRGLHVEVVALADTASYTMDIDAHVKEIGAICARYPNAIVEIANEPYHPTQAAPVHGVANLERLARLVDDRVPVALGAGDGTDDYPGGDFITVHFQRTSRLQGWGPVLELTKGAALASRHGKPVIDDEPIGAGALAQPGRRENDPEKFRAMGLVSWLLGLGATFHYEAGLQARVPEGVEAACFDAWMAGRTAVTDLGADEPRVIEAGSATSAVRRWERNRLRAVLEIRRDSRAFVVLLGVAADPGLELAEGWRSTVPVRRWPAVWLLALTR